MQLNYKKLSLLLLSWSSLSLSSIALIPLTEVPQELFTSVKKDKQSYNPLLGFMGAYSNTVKNVRFYGAYTPKEAFGRKFKNFKRHPQLQNALDQVPQDPIA